ncbi:phage head morphogenesis protein [Vacuolonema iberomarrocanum]|uniref:phage head morphogenesis protein n=1 Tax=Vacuolonema iberomarrocanum TaxID=3454632 RepID=UPI0019F42446|nr:hypothetical protein [filamentous cyanobacterium LEGE 07170]
MARTRAGYGDVPFAEAILFLIGKLNLDTESFDRVTGRYVLEDGSEVPHTDHDTRFVVAAAKGSLLQDIRELVESAIQDGLSRDQFVAEFKTRIAQRGWLEDRSEGYRQWRAETIYQTNLKTAYQAGRYQQQTEPAVLRTRPYWQYRHGDSRRPRPAHLALNGRVFPAPTPDNPSAQAFWDAFYPPNGFGCRCFTVSLNDRDLNRKGLELEAPPSVGSDEDFDGQRVRLQPDRGWDHTPGKTNLQERRQQTVSRLSPDIARQVEAETDG